MLNKCKENDFYVLKQISRGRLSPDNMAGFFWGAFVFSSIMTLVSYNASQSVNVSVSLWSEFMKFILILLAVQFLLTIFFTSTKNGYRFQRLQVNMLSFISFKISIEMYLVYFLACDDRDVPIFMTIIGLLMLIGGFFYLIISIFRGIHRVKKGKFRKGEKGLYDFQESKGYISIPIIYGSSVMGGVLATSLSNMNSLSSINDVIAPLLISMIIQYSIAMALPEFFLLAYCKSRFKSFNYIPKSFR